MPRHFQAFLADGNESSGVFLIRQRFDIGEAIEELLFVWLATESEEWADKIEWFPL